MKASRTSGAEKLGGGVSENLSSSAELYLVSLVTMVIFSGCNGRSKEGFVTQINELEGLGKV